MVCPLIHNTFHNLPKFEGQNPEAIARFPNELLWGGFCVCLLRTPSILLLSRHFGDGLMVREENHSLLTCTWCIEPVALR
jgi:hypothetical protein